MRILTKDANGKENGWVLPIWNCREVEYRPDQVYLTAIAPGCSKGPHLHKIRTGYFACVSGRVHAILRRGDQYETYRLGLYNAHEPLRVPPGVACELRNVGAEEAILINMPSPSWSADEPDEWTVEDWNPCK